MINIFQVAIEVPLEKAIDKVEVSPILDLGLLVSRMVGVALLIAAIACFLYLAYGGIRWVMAGGDSGKLDEAKQTITNAIIGLLVTAATWALFLIINHFLGLGIAKGGFGSRTPASPGTGGSSGTGTCVLGTYSYAGAAGGYCGPTGNTKMKCVSGDRLDPENISLYDYDHLEPYCCQSGTPNTGRFTFIVGGMCP